MSVNKVILVGRLGKDPEIRTTPGGTSVVRFSIATDERYTDRSGEKQQRTEWHNIVAWGKLAEVCAQYLRKGKQVFIEGSLRTESWEDKESGQKKYRTDINAFQMKMLGSKDDDEGGGRERGDYKDRNDTRGGGGSAAGYGDDDEEVPF